MLHDVKLVVDDDAPVRRPRLDAGPERFSHVPTGGPDRTPLEGTRILPENSSSVFFFGSWPNHNGSPLFRLLTTVRNFCFFPS
jgi:hypothetical protein